MIYALRNWIEYVVTTLSYRIPLRWQNKMFKKPKLRHFQMHLCSVAQNQNCINHLDFISLFSSPSVSSSLINIVDPTSRIIHFSVLCWKPCTGFSHTWNTGPSSARPSMTWPLDTSLSLLYTAITLLKIFQPPWPSSFSNMLSLFSCQSLCTGCLLCLEWSITRFLHD